MLVFFHLIMMSNRGTCEIKISLFLCALLLYKLSGIESSKYLKVLNALSHSQRNQVTFIVTRQKSFELPYPPLPFPTINNDRSLSLLFLNYIPQHFFVQLDSVDLNMQSLKHFPLSQILRFSKSFRYFLMRRSEIYQKKKKHSLNGLENTSFVFVIQEKLVIIIISKDMEVFFSESLMIKESNNDEGGEELFLLSIFLIHCSLFVEQVYRYLFLTLRNYLYFAYRSHFPLLTNIREALMCAEKDAVTKLANLTM